MSVARAIVRGTSRVLAGSVVARVLDFAYFLLLARALGVQRFGLLAFAIAYTLMFGVLADLGITTVFTRDVAREPRRARALLGDAVALKLVLGAATIAGSALVCRWTRLAGAEVTVPLLLLATSLVLTSFAVLFQGLLKAANRGGAVGVAVATKSLVTLGSGAMLLASGAGLRGAALAFVIGSVAQLAVSVAPCRDLLAAADPAPPGWRAGRSQRARGLLAAALPLAVSGAFITLYFRVDSVLLQAMKGAADVGLYGGVYRFFEAVTLVGAAYHSIAFPYMARAADGPPETLRVMWRRSFRAHLIVSLGLAVFATAFARPIVTLLLGPAYAPAAGALAVLIWAAPGSLVAATLFHLLVAQGRPAAAARAVGITAAFNVALNLALIPAWSYRGAAVATVASELVCFVLLYRAFGARVPRPGIAAVVWRPAAAAVLFAGALAYAAPRVPAGTPAFAIACAACAAAWSLLLVATRAVGRDDWELLRAALPGRAAANR